MIPIIKRPFWPPPSLTVKLKSLDLPEIDANMNKEIYSQIRVEVKYSKREPVPILPLKNIYRI